MIYTSEKNGSTTHKGRVIQYKKGENDVPTGALDHVPGCKRKQSKKKTSTKSKTSKK